MSKNDIEAGDSMVRSNRHVGESARDHYDMISAQYASTDWQVQPRSGGGFAEKLQSLCILNCPRNVCDLGVGSGHYFPFVRGSSLFVGIDISTGMLQQAYPRKHILTDNGFQVIKLLEGDLLEARKLCNESFDLVYSIGVLGYHLPLDRYIMNLVVSLLAPGGCFFVTTVQQSLGLRLRQFTKHTLWKMGFPVGSLLATFQCSPSMYSRLAKQVGLELAESLVFTNEAKWNGLSQCGAVFKRSNG